MKFDQLLEMLEDNEGDLLADGDLASRDTEEDGQGVLVSAYGSEQAAGDEAGKTAKALRLDESAVRRLMPVAAALVLAVLARRHKELAGPVLADEPDATDESNSAPDVVRIRAVRVARHPVRPPAARDRRYSIARAIARPAPAAAQAALEIFAAQAPPAAVDCRRRSSAGSPGNQ